MIRFRQAQQLLAQKAASFGKENIGLGSAFGRVLAGDLIADRDYPPFNRSSMDGYAIRYEDFQKGLRRFSITETIYAGSAGDMPVGNSQCCKIMTGAPLPEGADMVIRREEVHEETAMIDVLSESGRAFQYIARQGEDLRSGQRVALKACLCDPPVMGLLASLGQSEVLVERLPRVALLTTGDEVVDVGDPVGPAQIRNSNRWLLHSFLHQLGIIPARHLHLPDDRNRLLDSVGRMLREYQVVILSGAVSAGDADHVPGVLLELGAEMLFHQLAIKPGKPACCAMTKEGTMVFALPGNPFSCMVGFMLLVGPYLNACFGRKMSDPLRLPLLVPRKKKTPLDEFFPVRIEGSPTGVSPVPFNGSGDVRLGYQANALALHPDGAGDLSEGAELECYPFSGPF